MKRTHILLFGLCVTGIQVGIWGTVEGQEKVTLRLAYPEGQTAVYKNTYIFEYTSDKGKWLLPGRDSGGDLHVVITGEWRSQEKARPIASASGEATDTVEIEAALEKADSGVRIDGRPLTFQEYPFTLDLMNGRKFTWRFSPHGRVGHFSPVAGRHPPSRPGLVTDLRQFWMPEVCPLLPETDVGKGDTWTGEQAFEAVYSELGLMGLVGLKSTYEVKKIEKKKGQVRVVIQEDRKVRYRGWMYAGLLSLLLGGEGEGSGKWVIDISRGLVLSHDVRMEIDRPMVMLAGTREPLGNIRAETRWTFKRKLDKLKKE